MICVQEYVNVARELDYAIIHDIIQEDIRTKEFQHMNSWVMLSYIMVEQ